MYWATIQFLQKVPKITNLNLGKSKLRLLRIKIKLIPNILRVLQSRRKKCVCSRCHCYDFPSNKKVQNTAPHGNTTILTYLNVINTIKEHWFFSILILVNVDIRNYHWKRAAAFMAMKYHKKKTTHKKKCIHTIFFNVF